jgi:RNA-directed DNA polymerase
MSAATRARAPSGVTWEGINWARVHRHVRGLQARIVKATQSCHRVSKDALLEA